MKNAALLVAAAFNRLMGGIPSGDFGPSQSSPVPGPGVLRAAERLKAHRVAQAERLKDAPVPDQSRQVKRWEDRQWDKKALRHTKGLPPMRDPR